MALTFAVILFAAYMIMRQNDEGERSALSSEQAENPAPSFELADIDGELVSIDDFKGRVILLNFWATWCGPCKREIPDFIDLQNEYGDDGLTIVGIALDEHSLVTAFVKEWEINYPVLIGTEEVSMRYGNIRSIPTTFIIDRSGAVVKSYVGLQPRSVIEADVKALL